MLFKNVRVGQEVILALPKGNVRDGVFAYQLAEVEGVKSTTIVVDGFKFNMKDGRGRTIPHYIVPATTANKQNYVEGTANEPSPEPETHVEKQVDDQLRKLAREGLKIIRDTPSAQDDDLLELLGTEQLAAFRRQWKKLHG